MSESEEARELLSMAGKDLKALKHMTDTEAFAEEIFGFHAQQAVEKALKAWISALDQVYDYKHDLMPLLKQLEGLGQDVSELWCFTDLSLFAVQFRYDPLDIDSDQLDRQDMINKVQALHGKVAVIIEEIEKLR